MGERDSRIRSKLLGVHWGGAACQRGRDQREAPCAGEEVRGAFVTEEFLIQNF